MDSADRDGHPADADRERITTERPQMERFDTYAGVETEVAQTACLGIIKGSPVDRRDMGAGAEFEIVKA